ncbi:MAG: 5'-3' exonuclease [Cellvibrionaceae bacterium]
MSSKDTSEKQKNAPSILIDASIYIFQYYFSLPDHWYSKKDSWPTAAVYGYTAFLVRLLEQQLSKQNYLKHGFSKQSLSKQSNSTTKRHITKRYIAACFDESLASCFRNKIYPEYKCSRALPDEALAFQLKSCRRVTGLLGIKTYGSKTHEADDLLGSLYQPLVRTRKPIAILTRDKDLAQLLRRPQDFLWDYSASSKTSKAKQVGDDACDDSAEQIGVRHFQKDIEDKFGVAASQLIDYLALVGDSIDDIPGVPGVGPKTAQALLSHFGDVDSLFNDLQQVATLPVRGAKKLAEKLHLFRDQIAIAQQLATITDNIDLGVGLKDINWRPNSIEYDHIEDFCHRMGFPRLFSRMEKVFS